MEGYWLPQRVDSGGVSFVNNAKQLLDSLLAGIRETLFLVTHFRFVLFELLLTLMMLTLIEELLSPSKLALMLRVSSLAVRFVEFLKLLLSQCLCRH